MISWKECLISNVVLKITPDYNKANSLIEVANKRIEFINYVDKKQLNFVFELTYTSLNEYVHAYLIFKGYKVLNHICLAYFIRDVLNREDLFDKYDELRVKRNSLVYYGLFLDEADCLICLDYSKELIRVFAELLDLENHFISKKQ